MKEVTEENFTEAVSEGVVLVDFHAEWCNPCKMLGFVLEEVSKTDPPFEIVKVNIEDNVELADQFDVRSIPTLVVLKDGQKVDQYDGPPPTQSIIMDLVLKHIID